MGIGELMADQIRVIHVDDDPDLVELSETFLERFASELDVHTATDPTKVSHRVRKNGANLDCIVADYDMPQLDGLELLNIVRQEYPNLPFILFTGKGSEENASEAISLGVTDYMQKEVGSDQYQVLANRIRNAVDRRRAEADLKRRESVFETLARQEIVGIYIIQDEIFTYVNDKFASLFGYEPSEIIGTEPYRYVADEDSDMVRERIQERLEGEAKNHHYIFEGKRKDESTFPIEVHGGRTILDGEPATVGVLIEGD